ncbi:RING-H2 finger protein ATL1-like [Miscanthus floridulus]|uniref:RING-H2 finger protein ATL1-like n=1 Tax=Miscanthus floridulus TaxID=154761 RepID=UPI003459CC3A
MPQITPLLFASPPAAALPSSSLSLSSYSSSSLRGHAPSITSFPILVLTVLGILAASVFLLAYYVFVIRCCLTWHRGSSHVAGPIVSRRGLRPQRTGTTTSGSTAAADAGAEPRGLEDAAIRALPAFSYRKKPANAAAATDESSAPASECAVCLGEFEEGDKVRMLPACLHVFHLGCVDAWLQGNASCPLCRASADVAATLCRLPPLPPEEEVVVTIQVVVPGGAEEDGQDTREQGQREAIVPPAAEFEGEDTCTDRQVSGEKTKSTIDGMTERRKDGEVLPPRTRTSFSRDGDAMAGGGEVHLQIRESILQRDSHPRTHDSDSSGGGRVQCRQLDQHPSFLC